MKINNKWLLLAFVLTLSAVFLVSTGDVGAYTGIDGGYVGSTVCGTCHTAQKADFDKSGHPYKVRFTNGATPTAVSDPLSFLLIGYTPTLGTLSTLTNNALMVDDGSGRLAWSAVSYVIGGYGWKARWGIRDVADADGDGVNDTGYVWTGSGAQYNMHTNNYSAYNGGQDKKYSCAICHNTNGTSSVDAGCTTALGSSRTEPWASSGRTPALPGGFRSEWTFSGVQCEACHGTGEAHANAPSASNIVKNTSKDVCGKCHIRSTNTTGFGGECGGDAGAAILTNGAQNNGGGSLANQTVQHHEQYNELVGYNGDGVHASLDCVTCHDPHKRSHKVTSAIAGALGITDNDLSGDARGAIRQSCSDCHWAQDANGSANVPGHNSLACIDCHMAETMKSAGAKTGTWGVKADVKGHIFAINPSATTMDRTNADGKHIATNYMTVNFACGKCHDSAVYGSSILGPTDAASASTAAANYHNVAALTTPIDGGYVGSDICSTCHVQKFDDFVQSGHPYKVRFTNGATPTAVSDPLSNLLKGYTPTLGTLSTLTNNALKVDDGTGRLDWSAVSYVIGGYGWKARWGMRDTVADTVENTGYIWTGSGAQYNMLANNYGAYNAGTDKKYSCAICHNTNGTSSVDAGCTTALGSGRTEPWASSGRTPAVPGGFRSEWTFSGVQCEACHGPASTHVSTRSAADIVKNTSKDVCGKCHIRSTNTPGFGGECGGDAGAAILTNGAQNNGGGSLANQTVQHHEQYNELVGYKGDGAHASLDCVTCHDPHKRSHKVTSAIAGALGIIDNDLSGDARGAVVSCESCHPGKTLKYYMGDIKCIDCHMAETMKSATAQTGTWGVKADVKGHIFAINPSATTMDRINADGKHIATNYMTVNFACGKCHDATMSTSAGLTTFTLAEAQYRATNIHTSTNVAPTASFTSGQSGLTLTLTDTSSDDAAFPTNAVTVLWGDGSSSTANAGSVIPHTYATAGTFKITYKVKDAEGLYSYVMGTSATVSTNLTIDVTLSPAIPDKEDNAAIGGDDDGICEDGESCLPNPAKIVLKRKGPYGWSTKAVFSTPSGTTFTIKKLGIFRIKVVKSGYAFDCDAGTAGNQSYINVTMGGSTSVTCTHTP